MMAEEVGEVKAPELSRGWKATVQGNAQSIPP